MSPQLPEGVEDIASPALLIFFEALEQNLDRMVAIAGDPARLRPHVKTHKMRHIVRRLMARGVHKFKCATMVEARMLAETGAADILLAHFPVGPVAKQWCALANEFPEVRFHILVDCSETLDWTRIAVANQPGPAPPGVFLDIDNGMHRTGIEPGPSAANLAVEISRTPGVAFSGLHVYDGHLRDPDPIERRRSIDTTFLPVQAMWDDLRRRGVEVPTVVAGGTPSFASHADRAGVECSPGTTTLWDVSSETQFGEMGFVHAAALLTRVVSRPGPNRVCVDLGHKAVASEMPHPRVLFPSLGDVAFIGHSEEHLVFETQHAASLPPGTALLALPWHICPTVALYDTAVRVESGRPVGELTVDARSRIQKTWR
jgi:D-serine deaminase-like pyridoxal phosphate-dependent protein